MANQSEIGRASGAEPSNVSALPTRSTSTYDAALLVELVGQGGIRATQSSSKYQQGDSLAAFIECREPFPCQRFFS